MSEYQFNHEDVLKWMSAAKKVVTEAGELIKTNLGRAANLQDKGENISEGHASSVLTETDIAVENLFVLILRLNSMIMSSLVKKGVKVRMDRSRFLTTTQHGLLILLMVQ